MLTRRNLLAAALGAPLLQRNSHAQVNRVRIGITDWNLRLTCKPEAIPLAAKLGFEGVQVSCGRNLVDGKQPLDNPELIAHMKALSKENRIPIDGTCVDRLHTDGLKSEKAAVGWVRDAIRITRDLGTQVILLPFFGKWALDTPAEMDYTADALRDLGPEAEKAGVILGLENTISAEDNVRIMERSRSKAVLVYYDVGNSTARGFDVVKEIRWLGKARICQIHLKDNPNYLGEGKIQFVPIMQAIRDIGFTGYANLETDPKSPATLEADQRRNLEYIRSLVG
ncbi:MAG TPA: sugar phosphate isomerase/epimerase family protein [Candidatus Acidoferrales bacterium]|nr:sugar phosphate isomerase/epimerase family protein [Candidatus Acidoferrales bacterium]